MEQLREWYASPEYAEALQIRQTALARRLLFVAGVDDARDEGAAGDEGAARGSGRRQRGG